MKRKKSENLNRAFFDMGIRKMEGEGNERKFVLSFSSEEPYERWFGLEILSHKEGAMDMTRLNSIGILLYNHDKDKVIGKIRKAWIQDRRGMAEVEFDKDEASQTIFEKVESGTLKGVSVGYVVSNWEEVEKGKKSLDGRFDGPCSIATRWMPYEISIVSIPADATVGVGRSKEETEEVGDSYFYEKQLQINVNLLRRREV